MRAQWDFNCFPIFSFSNSESSSGFNSSKPPPRERMLLRSKTVAGGLGSAKLSKKAMLLKWCQIMTEEYEVSYAHALLNSKRS